MPDLNFGLLDLIGERLDKHKDKLGPLHRPLVLLFGAILFVAFLALLIGAPILWLDDFVYIAVLQVCLIAAFFMLLLTIPLNVYDRFVFCMALFLILAAAPIMVTVSFFLGNMDPENPAAFGEAVSSAKPEIFMYALLRGLGQLAWSLPPLFLFFTFYPRIRSKGPKNIQSRLSLTTWAAVVMHTIAVSLHVWLGGTTKVFKSVDATMPALASSINQYQMGFLVFQSLYLLLGYATIFAARRWYNGDDNRWLGIVAAGMIVVQGCYMIASYNNRQLDLRYPAARTTANYVETWKTRGGDQYVFTVPRPNTISPIKFAAFKAYAVCEVPESLKFSLKVANADEFLAQFVESSLANVPAEETFCQPRL
jgi:hypothetical protein